MAKLNGNYRSADECNLQRLQGQVQSQATLQSDQNASITVRVNKNIDEKKTSNRLLELIDAKALFDKLCGEGQPRAAMTFKRRTINQTLYDKCRKRKAPPN